MEFHNNVSRLYISRHKTEQDVQLSQTDRAAGCIILAKSGRLEVGDITDIIGWSSTTVTQFTRLTDRQTERQTEFSSLDRVCILQRGKK